MSANEGKKSQFCLISFILFCCICNFRVIRADFAFFGQFWPIKIRNIGKFHWLDFFLDQFDRFIYKSVFWDYFFWLFFQGFEPDSKISEKRKFPEALRVLHYNFQCLLLYVCVCPVKTAHPPVTFSFSHLVLWKVLIRAVVIGYFLSS